MSQTTDEILAEEPSGEVVHWMEPGPMRLGVGAVSVTTIAAFALGIAVALGAIAAVRWIAPRREALPPWRWRRGALH